MSATAPTVNTPTRLLSGGRVVTPDGVLHDGWVQIVDGRIRAVGSGAQRPELETPVTDLGGAWLLPGYVDLHQHGGGGHNNTASLEQMQQAARFHLSHGTTSLLVSLMTASEEALAEQLRWAAELTRRGPSADGQILGAHMEGPFLAQHRCGAQNTEHMIPPDMAMMERLMAIAGETLQMVTLAPELPGALPMIERLHQAGVIVAMGHSDADYEQARAGIRAGATHATHLFNAMPPLHHRAPGLVGAALEAGLTCELINDGTHVHPAIVEMVFQAIDIPVLVTDAIDATGFGDGIYELGGQEVRVQGGVARLTSTGSLAGSTLTMDRALRLAVQACGQSIERASAAASGNPARVLGLEHELGAIAPGLRADLVVLNDELEIANVIVGGAWRTER